jgi:hypothetical protein
VLPASSISLIRFSSPDVQGLEGGFSTIERREDGPRWRGRLKVTLYDAVRTKRAAEFSRIIRYSSRRVVRDFRYNELPYFKTVAFDLNDEWEALIAEYEANYF